MIQLIRVWVSSFITLIWTFTTILKRQERIEARLDSIATNHLHALTEKVEANGEKIKRIGRGQARILGELSILKRLVIHRDKE
jgi:hypothetical protein